MSTFAALAARGRALLELLLVIALVTLVAGGLYLTQRHQTTPPPQDTHTGILKGTVHDPRADCDPTEMTVECNGSRLR
jgi:hypothetical protein